MKLILITLLSLFVLAGCRGITGSGHVCFGDGTNHICIGVSTNAPGR